MKDTSLPAVMRVDFNDLPQPLGWPDKMVAVGDLVIMVDISDGAPFMCFGEVVHVHPDINFPVIPMCQAKPVGATYGREYAYAAPVPHWEVPDVAPA